MLAFVIFFFQHLPPHFIFSCSQGFRGSIFHWNSVVLFYRTRVLVVHALRTLRAFQTLNHSTIFSACVLQALLEKLVLSVSRERNKWQFGCDIISKICLYRLKSHSHERLYPRLELPLPILKRMICSVQSSEPITCVEFGAQPGSRRARGV